jgi:hypothetical protein
VTNSLHQSTSAFAGMASQFRNLASLTPLIQRHNRLGLNRRNDETLPLLSCHGIEQPPPSMYPLSLCPTRPPPLTLAHHQCLPIRHRSHLLSHARAQDDEMTRPDEHPATDYETRLVMRGQQMRDVVMTKLPPPSSKPRNAARWCQLTPALLLQGFSVGFGGIPMHGQVPQGF